MFRLIDLAAAASGSGSQKGIQIMPSVIAFQTINLIVFLFILNYLVFKPLLKLIKERAEKIKRGVEDAEKANLMIQESEETRHDMLRNTKLESRAILEDARKSAENVKADIIENAQKEAGKIVIAGTNAIEEQKAKVAKELQYKMADMVVMAAEKILRKKIDSNTDANLIEESIKSVNI